MCVREVGSMTCFVNDVEPTITSLYLYANIVQYLKHLASVRVEVIKKTNILTIMKWSHKYVWNCL